MSNHAIPQHTHIHRGVHTRPWTQQVHNKGLSIQSFFLQHHFESCYFEQLSITDLMYIKSRSCCRHSRTPPFTLCLILTHVLLNQSLPSTTLQAKKKITFSPCVFMRVIYLACNVGLPNFYPSFSMIFFKSIQSKNDFFFSHSNGFRLSSTTVIQHLWIKVSGVLGANEFYSV